MSPGTDEPTGIVASSPKQSMIIPNEFWCKVDVSHPTVTYSAGARRMTSCSTREVGARFLVSVGMSCIRVFRLPFSEIFIAQDEASVRFAPNIF
jgi:hypothetical protein